MTDSVLLRAILAMDAYNRGDAPGILGMGQVGISSASFSTDSTLAPETSEGSAAGFYAVAYTLSDGSKVISYRGTDQNSPAIFAGTEFGSDLFNGYGLAIGSPYSNQTQLAIAFYKAIANGEDPRAANIAVTGHSLGGALAGVVGGLFGNNGSLFDNMPFEQGLDAAYRSASLNYWSFGLLGSTQLRNDIYGAGMPWAVDRSNLSGAYVYGEFIQPYRAATGQQTSLQELVSDGGVRDPFSELHSISLLVQLLWAKDNSNDQWRAIAPELLNALFADDAGNAVGVASLKGASSIAGVLRDLIAYTAIDVSDPDEGKPFGDSAIRAMFDDADQLGKVYKGAVNPLLETSLLTGLVNGTVKDALAEIAVQFAGDLAKGYGLPLTGGLNCICGKTKLHERSGQLC